LNKSQTFELRYIVYLLSDSSPVQIPIQLNDINQDFNVNHRTSPLPKQISTSPTCNYKTPIKNPTTIRSPPQIPTISLITPLSKIITSIPKIINKDSNLMTSSTFCTINKGLQKTPTSRILRPLQTPTLKIKTKIRMKEVFGACFNEYFWSAGKKANQLFFSY
jgi:hypothetical protein